MSDMNFEKLLEDHNQAFEDAEAFSNWMPPDSEYIALVKTVNTGVMTQDNVSIPWWKLIGELIEADNPELDKKEFSLGFYSGKQMGMLKGLASTLKGEPVNKLGEANDVLHESVGKVVKVKVESRVSKKDGNEYTNARILEVLETTPA